jgi:hypothetical protein
MEWGEIVENLQALPELPTPQNVTVRSPRPRDYLTEREVEKLMVAARANRWGHRDATAILLAYRHGLRRSAGFSPLRMRSTYPAACRYSSIGLGP